MAIVYLLQYKYVSEGEYSDVIIDFRTSDDVAEFNRRFEQSQLTTATILCIDTLHIDRRLRAHCYYTLNLDLIAKATIDTNTNSYVIGANITNVPRGDADHPLLDTHEPLPYEFQPVLPTAVPTVLHAPAEQLLVHDVGQGSLFEIRSHQMPILYFDFGYYVKAPKQQVAATAQQLITRRVPHLPALIISHFDADHYHCLLALQGNLSQYFSTVVCPSEVKTLTSQRLLRRLTTDMGANLHIISTPHHKRMRGVHPPMDMIHSEPSLTIYKGRSTGNINRCGIIAFVSGVRATALLSGDSYIVQTSDVVNHHYPDPMLPAANILTVPHHGGSSSKVYRRFTPPAGMHPQAAAISVNATHYPPHPDPTVLREISALYPQVHRTDQQGTLTYPL